MIRCRAYVVKPVNEGSSVGVAIVTRDGNHGSPIGRDVEGPWLHFEELLAEPYIRGRELTTAVLGDEALLVTELRPKSGFYDFDAKYTDGMTEHVCPADIPQEISEACKAIALRAHQLLGCKGRRGLISAGTMNRNRRAVPAGSEHAAGHDAAQPGA